MTIGPLDQTWGWQQNRAIVGHNLKIAWNLTRMFSLNPKPKYRNSGRTRSRTLIPAVRLRYPAGGWYDVVERVLAPGEKHPSFRVARSQSLVAAGAGYLSLLHHGRRLWGWQP